MLLQHHRHQWFSTTPKSQLRSRKTKKTHENFMFCTVHFSLSFLTLNKPPKQQEIYTITFLELIIDIHF
jgi:hypothetical protein